MDFGMVGKQTVALKDLGHFQVMIDIPILLQSHIDSYWEMCTENWNILQVWFDKNLGCEILTFSSPEISDLNDQIYNLLDSKF